MVGAAQGRVFVGAPFMETEQDCSIRVEDLPEVGVGRSRRGKAKERLVPPETGRHIGAANDRPCTLHTVLLRPNVKLRGAALLRRPARTPGWAIVDDAHDFRPTKRNASRARASQSSSDAGSSDSHSFMSRPWPGSKRRPAPEASNASTRCFGSFTTKFPLEETIAKIFPPTWRAEEPKPFLPAAPTVTFGSLASVWATALNRLCVSNDGFDMILTLPRYPM